MRSGARAPAIYNYATFPPPFFVGVPCRSPFSIRFIVTSAISALLVRYLAALIGVAPEISFSLSHFSKWIVSCLHSSPFTTDLPTQITPLVITHPPLLAAHCLIVFPAASAADATLDLVTGTAIEALIALNSSRRLLVLLAMEVRYRRAAYLAIK